MSAKNSEETKKLYDTYGLKYDELTKNYIHNHIQDDFDTFLKLLPWKFILDVWCGWWRDVAFFKEKWFFPIWIDFSDTMIDICNSKWLEAYKMDMKKLNFEVDTFDGVWAYTSLLHLPKSDISWVITDIKKVLKPWWIFYIWMKEWDFEWMAESKKYPDCKRYFSYYLESEMRTILSDFEIISFSRVEISSKQKYINFLCKKNK